jgi:hypothetical protein
MTTESLISKTLAPDLVPGWLPTWEDHAPHAARPEHRHRVMNSPALPLRQIKANPEILGECCKGHSPKATLAQAAPQLKS